MTWSPQVLGTRYCTEGEGEYPNRIAVCRYTHEGREAIDENLISLCRSEIQQLGLTGMAEDVAAQDVDPMKSSQWATKLQQAVYNDLQLKSGGRTPVEVGGEGETGEEQQDKRDEASGAGKGRPPLCWTEDYCPSCQTNKVEFISFRKFAQRCKEVGASMGRKTVSRRVNNEKYWANADWKVPWCEECQERTPKGEGRRRPVDKRASPEDSLDEDDRAHLTGMIREVIHKEWPSFSLEQVKEAGKTGVQRKQHSPKGSKKAEEAYHIALKSVLERTRDNEGDLPPQNVVKDLTRSAIEEVKREEGYRRNKISFRDFSTRPEEDE